MVALGRGAIGLVRALLVVAGLSPGAEAWGQPGRRGDTIGKVASAVTTSAVVPVPVQRMRGLVSISGGGCSATLINRAWVLTADHCITTNGAIGGPAQAFANVPITATWSTVRVIPTRYVRYFQKGLDIALIYLGGGDFGPVDIQLLYVGGLEGAEPPIRMTKFGQGIFTFAMSPTQPALNDGQYRTAIFGLGAVTDLAVVLPANAASGLFPAQAGNGGDSGGPDYVTGANGVLLGIASVQSTCVPTGYVPGMPTNWNWATGVASCSSARVEPIRFEVNQTVQFGLSRRAQTDFTGDQAPDIVWHNSIDGMTQIWSMSLSSRIGRANVAGEDGALTRIGPPWSIVGANDFNRDRNSDLLWHNSQTGETQMWLMRGARVVRRATVTSNGQPVQVGAPWGIVGSNDFNSDGIADILWHNANTGETQIWLMNESAVVRRATVDVRDGGGAMVGLPWRIAGTGDFDADGKADILWHNGQTQQMQVWFMEGSSRVRRAPILFEDGSIAAVGLPWRIVGAADYDGDGQTDIHWHNGASGETQLWLLKGARVAGRLTVDASRDGGAALVGMPWISMPH